MNAQSDLPEGSLFDRAKAKAASAGVSLPVTLINMARREIRDVLSRLKAAGVHDITPVSVVPPSAKDPLVRCTDSENLLDTTLRPVFYFTCPSSNGHGHKLDFALTLVSIVRRAQMAGLEEEDCLFTISLFALSQQPEVMKTIQFPKDAYSDTHFTLLLLELMLRVSDRLEHYLAWPLVDLKPVSQFSQLEGVDVEHFVNLQSDLGLLALNELGNVEYRSKVSPLFDALQETMWSYGNPFSENSVVACPFNYDQTFSSWFHHLAIPFIVTLHYGFTHMHIKISLWIMQSQGFYRMLCLVASWLPLHPIYSGFAGSASFWSSDPMHSGLEHRFPMGAEEYGFCFCMLDYICTTGLIPSKSPSAEEIRFFIKSCDEIVRNGYRYHTFAPKYNITRLTPPPIPYDIYRMCSSFAHASVPHTINVLHKHIALKKSQLDGTKGSIDSYYKEFCELSMERSQVEICVDEQERDLRMLELRERGEGIPEGLAIYFEKRGIPTYITQAPS